MALIKVTPHAVLLRDSRELARMKQDPELRHIPIVVLTTSNTEADRRRAYENHANS